jgi:hypothetical protein
MLKLHGRWHRKRWVAPGRCVPRGQRTTRAVRQSPKAQTGSQPGRRFACTWCRAIRPTLRNRTFGSSAELGARHRQRWVAPGRVGGTDNDGWHRHRVGGTCKTTRPVSRRWKRGQRITQHSTNRRRHKPPFRRAEGTNRLSARRTACAALETRQEILPDRGN